MKLISAIVLPLCSCAASQDLCSPSSVPDAADYDQRSALVAGISAHYPSRRSTARIELAGCEQQQNGRADLEVRSAAVSLVPGQSC